MCLSYGPLYNSSFFVYHFSFGLSAAVLLGFGFRLSICKLRASSIIPSE